MPYTLVNPLCTLAEVKAALQLTDTVDDDRISLAIDAASRLIEEECNRRFYLDTQVSARLFVSQSPWLCEVDDIATTTGMIVQTDYAGDGTFGTTWAATDYQCEPVNGLWQGEAWPTTQLRAIRSLYFPVWGGIAYPRPYTQALVKVTATWGWPAVPAPVHQAAVIQSIAIYKSTDAPFGATPFAETGVMRLRAALHPQADLLIDRYKENAVFCA